MATKIYGITTFLGKSHSPKKIYLAKGKVKNLIETADSRRFRMFLQLEDNFIADCNYCSQYWYIHNHMLDWAYEMGISWEALRDPLAFLSWEDWCELEE